MDARQVPLEENKKQDKRTIKRKNSAEEKVKLIEAKEKEALADEKSLKLEIPRKGSKEKVLSPRFFVRSASNEKKEKETKSNNNASENGQDYKKIY